MNASAKKVAIIALLIALMMLLTGCAGSTDLKYFVYNSWVSGTMEVSEYIGSDTDVKIPDKINGKPVGFLPFTFKDNPTQNLCCTDMAISTVLVGRKNLIVLVSILIFQEILFTGSDLSPLTMQISVFNTPPCAFGKMTFTFAALTA